MMNEDAQWRYEEFRDVKNDSAVAIGFVVEYTVGQYLPKNNQNSEPIWSNEQP